MTTEDTHDIELFGEDLGACPYCGTPFEFVRPGKSRPACDCQEPVEWLTNWRYRKAIQDMADAITKLTLERNTAYRALGYLDMGYYLCAPPWADDAIKAARAFVDSESESEKKETKE